MIISTPRPDDEHGGAVWHSVFILGSSIVLYESGVYRLPRVPTECQSDRPHRILHSQQGLEPQEGMGI